MYLDTEKCIQIQKIFVRKQSRKGEWKSFCSYLVVFSSEHLYSHDGKNEPENEADQKDVEDTGNGLHESIYNDLGQKEDGKIETFPSSLSFFKAVALQETEPACSSVICKSTILGGLSCDLHPVKHHYRQGSLQKANDSVLSNPIFFKEWVFH